jgi:hypothetical protein
MTNGISLDRRSGVSLGGVSKAGKGASAAAGGAMTAVAGRVATALAKELRLARDERDASHGGSTSDPYAIDALAAELTAEIGGGPSDVGTLSRALHQFAQETAALMGARPESGSVQAISDAITTSKNGDAPVVQANIADIVQLIDRATLRISGGG